MGLERGAIPGFSLDTIMAYDGSLAALRYSSGDSRLVSARYRAASVGLASSRMPHSASVEFTNRTASGRSTRPPARHRAPAAGLRSFAKEVDQPRSATACQADVLLC